MSTLREEELLQLKLGRDRRHGMLEQRSLARIAVLQLVRQCRYRIEIYTPNLEAELYSRSDFVEAIKQLALASPRSRIRILLRDNRRAQQEGHLLIPLATRLTSRIEIRTPPDDQALPLESLLLANATGYCLRKAGKHHLYEFDFNDPTGGRRQLEAFDELWENSSPDSQLRRLQI